jgi:hypothetical protein
VLKTFSITFHTNYVGESVLRAERFDRDMSTGGESDNTLRTRYHPFVHGFAAW